jgi:hypothetical protein
MTGSDAGNLLLFDDIQNGVTGPFNLLDDAFGLLDMGNRSAPVLADLNGDGLYELIAGNQRGGLELFSTSLSVGITSVVSPVKPERPYILSGSLTDGVVDVTWKNGSKGSLIVYDLLGRMIPMVSIQNEMYTRFDLRDAVPGVYLVQIKVGENTWVEKVVKK